MVGGRGGGCGNGGRRGDGAQRRPGAGTREGGVGPVHPSVRPSALSALTQNMRVGGQATHSLRGASVRLCLLCWCCTPVSPPASSTSSPPLSLLNTARGSSGAHPTLGSSSAEIGGSWNPPWLLPWLLLPPPALCPESERGRLGGRMGGRRMDSPRAAAAERGVRGAVWVLWVWEDEEGPAERGPGGECASCPYRAAVEAVEEDSGLGYGE